MELISMEYTWNKLSDNVLKGIMQDAGLSIKDTVQALQMFDLEIMTANDIYNVLVDYRLNKELGDSIPKPEYETPADILKSLAEKTGIKIHDIKVSKLNLEDFMGVPQPIPQPIPSIYGMPSIFNIATDMQLDPNKYEELDIFELAKGNPFLLSILSHLKSQNKK
jgi:hypothetical protein